MDVEEILPQYNDKKKKKSGGFQSMNISRPVVKGILKKGYKVPTPIQRKTIPPILEGKNVVAMARTGSGKTAAFLIPMLEKLKNRVSTAGARALIFSPTRELALQTLKFTKELAVHTGIKAAIVLGGESIENQFAALHESPDVIIATPGRFLHLVVEMDLKLTSIEYVVFDEADRLFELGFQEQLQEVLHRLNSERQTLLFSATLPKVLVDFIKVVGIDDPVLIRLDVELQISENLKNTYLMCRTDDKTAVLLHLLKNAIDIEKELTVVFLATKHHIEYMKEVLETASIPCSYIYSSLDQVARTIHIAKFRARKVGVLLVTDIAARGIDIPLLDNVINYNFPAKPKLFIHRVGRVARAGRSGRAFSLIAADEAPFLLDLHLFLGTPIKFAQTDSEDTDGVCGSVPQTIVDDEADLLHSWHQRHHDLANLLKVSQNAYKQYIKSRPAPSSESVKRMKEMTFSSTVVHPLFKDATEDDRNKMLADMKNFRPNSTVFELGSLAKTNASAVMRKKRKAHSRLVRQNQNTSTEQTTTIEKFKSSLVKADEEDLKGFTTKFKRSSYFKKFKDEDNYISYIPNEYYKEKGLGLQSSFEHQAAGAVLDFTGDDDAISKKMKNSTRWDRKKKKFVQNEDVRQKKMKTASGAWIPKTYKSDLYKKWQEKNKVRYRDNNDEEDGNENQVRNNKSMPIGFKGRKKARNQMGNGRKPPRRELKNKDEIYKERARKEKLMEHAKKKQQMRAKRGKKGRK